MQSAAPAADNIKTDLDRKPEVEAGIYLIDKPVGPTSFRIVQQVRRALGIKKVGHAGTLDPFASGLLILCAGRPATRIIDKLMGGDKEYEATLLLGVETDTQDLEGKVVQERPVGDISRAAVEECLSGFLGEGMQTPPCYSALKHKGKPLYYYARKGIEVVKPPRRIMISELQLVDLGPNRMTIRVKCSKGTYVRTLASDIGKALGCGAHLTALRRLQNGNFSVKEALPGDCLEDRNHAKIELEKYRMSVDEVLGRL